MSEAAERTVKSTQEQAVASWIMFLNQRRLEILIDRLNQQDINLEEALNELNEIKKFIGDAEHILGNASTKHGEIAEVMQVRIANARRLIKGLARNHSFEGVGRTAPEDYMRNGKSVDRSGGWHLTMPEDARVIAPSDPRVALPIPQTEIDANPNIVQNPR